MRTTTATAATLLLVAGALVVSGAAAARASIDASAATAAEVRAAGYDADALAGVVRAVEGDALSGCVSVVKDGRMLLNHAWGQDDDGLERGPGAPRRVNSVSKSVAAALVGVALQRGDLASLDEPAATYIDAWANTASENVTIRQLLTMTSGRYYSVTADYFWPNVIGGRSLRAFAEGDAEELFSYSEYSTLLLPQESPPGSEWVYNNAGVQALEAVLSEATGAYNVDEYAREHLYAPLGMNDTRYSLDLVGKPILSGGLRSTCEDMSRFAMMYLRGGAGADGTQVVPEEFAALTSAPRPATDLNGAYGYLWWRPNRDAATDSPLPWVGAERTFVGSPSNACVLEYASEGADTEVLPDLPADAFVAAGNQGYCVIVVPSENLILSKLSAELGTPMLNAWYATTAPPARVARRPFTSRGAHGKGMQCETRPRDRPNEATPSIGGWRRRPRRRSRRSRPRRRASAARARRARYENRTTSSLGFRRSWDWSTACPKVRPTPFPRSLVLTALPTPADADRASRLATISRRDRRAPSLARDEMRPDHGRITLHPREVPDRLVLRGPLVPAARHRRLWLLPRLTLRRRDPRARLPTRSPAEQRQ